MCINRLCFLVRPVIFTYGRFVESGAEKEEKNRKDGEISKSYFQFGASVIKY